MFSSAVMSMSVAGLHCLRDYERRLTHEAGATRGAGSLSMGRVELFDFDGFCGFPVLLVVGMWLGGFGHATR